MRRSLLTALATVVLASPVFAEDKAEKKPKGHCEKSTADGAIEDIEAADKADCKAKGGKWNKKAKGDHSHDKHD